MLAHSEKSFTESLTSAFALKEKLLSMVHGDHDHDCIPIKDCHCISLEFNKLCRETGDKKEPLTSLHSAEMLGGVIGSLYCIPREPFKWTLYVEAMMLLMSLATTKEKMLELANRDIKDMCHIMLRHLGNLLALYLAYYCKSDGDASSLATPFLRLLKIKMKKKALHKTSEVWVASTNVLDDDDVEFLVEVCICSSSCVNPARPPTPSQVYVSLNNPTDNIRGIYLCWTKFQNFIAKKLFTCLKATKEAMGTMLDEHFPSSSSVSAVPIQVRYTSSNVSLHIYMHTQYTTQILSDALSFFKCRNTNQVYQGMGGVSRGRLKKQGVITLLKK